MTGLTGGQGIDLSAVQILYKVHYTGSANFHSVQLFTASLYSPGVQILYKTRPPTAPTFKFNANVLYWNGMVAAWYDHTVSRGRKILW